MKEESAPNLEETVKVSISSTECARCIFATYDGDVQNGCAAHRLEKFHAADIPIIPFSNQETGTTSFIIDGKTCVYYRNKEWAKKYYDSEDTDHILTKVKNELIIPYHVILFFKTENSLEDVNNRLAELENQKVKPKILTIIDRSHTEKVMTGKLMKICQNYKFNHWRIQAIQAVDQLDTDIIDLAYDNIKKMKYMFYMVFDCTHPIPLHMSEDIHTALHNDMKTFVFLKPNSHGEGKTVLRAAHEKYSGNAFTIPLEDKIVHYDDAPHLIKKVEEICPSLQVS
jgi:hypothetical protein